MYARRVVAGCSGGGVKVEVDEVDEEGSCEAVNSIGSLMAA